MKRQDYVFGSTTSNVTEQTTTDLNNGWVELSILYSRVLNGVLKALSSSTNDVSQEVANAIVGMGTELNPLDSSQLLSILQTMALKASDFESPITASNKGITKSELTALNTTLTENIDTKATKETDFESPITATNKGATMKEIEEVTTSSLTFKGFVGTSQPTQTLVEGNLWINASSMPTSFPVPASSIKEWNGTAWVAYGSSFTPANFDFFRNNNNNEGYYWFGGEWKIMSTDMSTEYFTLNQVSGKWEINPAYNATLVHTSGDEAIGGTKTFTASYLSISNAAGTGGSGLNIIDSNGKGKSFLHHFYRDGKYISSLGGRNDTSERTACIEVVVNDDGKSEFNSYNIDNMYAPTPAVSSNSTNIATTAWFNNKMQVVSSLPSSPTSGVFYFIPE